MPRPARLSGPFALALCASVALVPAVPTPALAQGHGEGEAAAEVLFQDGKRLFEARQFADACPKIAESYRLDPAGGTILLLALCYEGEGKTASAWAAFNDALGIARRDKREDREARAREKLAQLEPTLSRLTITVAPALASLEGLEVRRNGKPVPRPLWGTAVPVDPGPQLVEAVATGKQPFTTRVAVAPSADKKIVDIARLDDAPQAPPPAAPSASPSSTPSATAPPAAPGEGGSRGMRTGAYVAGAVGLVALGGGVFFGLRAKSRWDSAQSACPEVACNDRQAVDDSKSAKSAGTWSTVGFGVGAAAVAASAVLFVLSGREASPGSASGGLRVVPAGNAHGGGLLLRGDL